MINTKVTFIIFTILFAHFGYSQANDSFIKEDSSKIIDPVEDWPIFPNGEIAMHCFIYHSLDTIKLRQVRETGLIIAHFIIDTTGFIKNIEILKGVDSIADNEFVRVIKMMPPWEPAKQNDKKVGTYFNLALRLPYINKFCH